MKSPYLYHRLRRPYLLGRFLLRRPHDPEFGVFALFRERTGAFLDVGANAGMSALSFRLYNRHAPIVSIEPNPFHEVDLRFVARFARPFSYRLWAAGDEAGSMMLYVPIYRGVAITTEASLIESEVRTSPSLQEKLGERMESDQFSVVSRVVDVHPLDELGLDPAFVKLDLQGFEDRALRGLAKTLRRAQPILLIEAPRTPLPQWLKSLELTSLGYSAFRYMPDEHRLVCELEGAANIVFVPPESLTPEVLRPGGGGRQRSSYL